MDETERERERETERERDRDRERECKRKRERGREKGGERESNCAVLDTSTENTLASCQSDGARLIDFLLFSISISLCVPLSLQNVPRCQRPRLFSLHPLCCTPGSKR